MSPAAPLDPGAALFLALKKHHQMYFGDELEQAVRKLPVPGYLVEGLIPSSSVNILVGDSGLGKSPLAFQLALCVAAGMPFLGWEARKAKVLLMDYENTFRDTHRILEQQRKHLGLAAYPSPELLIWPVQKDPPRDGFEPVIRQLAPDLVILDSLRSFSPTMESDNVAAVLQIRKLRKIAARHGTAMLLIHHVRKGRFSAMNDLEDGPALDWLLRAAGARALINQTDVRLAVSMSKCSEADLVLRGHHRTRGEIGPYLLSRVWDEAGEPAGYERLQATTSMLENPDQEVVFQRLPESFSFQEARHLYGKMHAATSLFLHKLIRLGLLVKTDYGKYKKTGFSPQTSIGATA